MPRIDLSEAPHFQGLVYGRSNRSESYHQQKECFYEFFIKAEQYIGNTSHVCRRNGEDYPAALYQIRKSERFFFHRQQGLRRLDAHLLSDSLWNRYSMFETNDEEYDRLENQFLDTLNGTDREIYLMRKQGLTQAEIAERLGYKTHSAVTKRMEKMRKSLIDFCADFNN